KAVAGLLHFWTWICAKRPRTSSPFTRRQANPCVACSNGPAGVACQPTVPASIAKAQAVALTPRPSTLGQLIFVFDRVFAASRCGADWLFHFLNWRRYHDHCSQPIRQQAVDRVYVQPRFVVVFGPRTSRPDGGRQSQLYLAGNSQDADAATEGRSSRILWSKPGF